MGVCTSREKEKLEEKEVEIDKSKPILVTGATGYIASHTIKLLLEKGYKVRGTVRFLLHRATYDFLYDLAQDKKDNLTMVEAELQNADSWLAAVDGCSYVIHIASPYPLNPECPPEEIIQAAVEGTKSVLNAALAKGVKKVIVTSSWHNLYNSKKVKVYDEKDWAEEENYKELPYAKSKLLAEKVVWDFFLKNHDKIEVVILHPGMVYGPILIKHKSASETIATTFFEGDYVAGTNPDDILPVVDVRDVAEGHVKALTLGASGKRYALCNHEILSFKGIVDILRDEFEKYGYTFPHKNRTGGSLNVQVDNTKSIQELEMKYRLMKDSLVDMGESLIDQKIFGDKRKDRPNNYNII